MFDIGFTELVVIAVVSLVVMGPERLPETVRSINLWIGRARQALSSARKELENEVGMDDIRQQLHNEEVMRDLANAQRDTEELVANVKAAPGDRPGT
ncbi:MAG: Sec-independent protein translocase protein TatB [Porticoccaceae bacterium]|nr:Sec-independent protein translocase protein TatB [Porticoccaceae bacterium]